MECGSRRSRGSNQLTWRGNWGGGKWGRAPNLLNLAVFAGSKENRMKCAGWGGEEGWGGHRAPSCMPGLSHQVCSYWVPASLTYLHCLGRRSTEVSFGLHRCS